MNKKLLILTGLLLLTGCSDSLEGHVINQAVDLCKDNGGIDKVIYKGVGWEGNLVTCNNGKRFRNKDFYDHIVGQEIKHD